MHATTVSTSPVSTSPASLMIGSGHVEDLSRLEFERRTEMENVKCTLQKKQVA